jgi:HAD superfamily hydrolase (TIGR01549 family)
MKSKFDGIIFDVDGTLTSTNELIFATFNHVTEKYLGKTYTPDEIVEFFGPTEDQLLKQLIPNDYENARKDYYEFYRNNHAEMANLFDGIKSILEYIKSKNTPLGIYTGKGRESTTITLKMLGILDYFDFIATGDDVENHKPSPEGILNFVNNFNLDKDKVLMIGDAPSDVKASRDAGVKIASVVWESYAKDKVLTLESDWVFHSVQELKAFIEESI